MDTKMKKENKRKPGGRPQLSPCDRRIYQVKTTMNPAEFAVFNKRLEQSHLCCADFVRDMVLKGKVVAPLSPEELRMLGGLHKLGQNMSYVIQHTSGQDRDALLRTFSSSSDQLDEIHEYFRNVVKPSRNR